MSSFNAADRGSRVGRRGLAEEKAEKSSGS